MKKLLLLSLTAASVMSFFGSCSVNKRVYRDGYHIEWNHNNSSAKQDQPVEEPKEESAQVNAEEAIPVESLGEMMIPEVPAEASAAPEASKPAEKKKSVISRIIKEDTEEDLMLINSGSKAAAFKSGFKKGLKLMMPDAEGHTLRLAIASFVLGLISLFAYYGAFVLGVLAIIFGAIALRKIRNSAGAYRGSTFAWIGLICGIVSLVIALIIIRVY
jgi:hypothetical protein